VEWASAIYATGDEAVWVNYFVPSSTTLELNGSEVAVEQETDYPGGGRTTLTVTAESPTDFALKIRTPSWADSVSLNLDGKELKAEVKDGYVEVRRSWSGTSRVAIEFPMTPRLVRPDGNDFGSAIDEQKGAIFGDGRGAARNVGSAGIKFGPVWLAAKDDLGQSERLMVDLGEPGGIRLDPASGHPSRYSWSVTGFSAEVAGVAGGKSRRIELKPLSSWTAEWPYREEMVNFVVDGEKGIKRESVRFVFPTAVVRAGEKGK
jgi:hypothetical protein